LIIHVNGDLKSRYFSMFTIGIFKSAFSIYRLYSVFKSVIFTIKIFPLFNIFLALAEFANCENGESQSRYFSMFKIVVFQSVIAEYRERSIFKIVILSFQNRDFQHYVIFSFQRRFSPDFAHWSPPVCRYPTTFFPLLVTTTCGEIIPAC